MKRLVLGLATFALGLGVLHHVDNPPPGIEELHAARTTQAIGAAEATLSTLRRN